MPSPALVALLEHTTFTAHLITSGERAGLYQSAKRRRVTRVQPGCYVESSYWAALTPHSRHCARAHLAALRFGDDLEFSHLTAAALWRLPVIGDWPSRVHVASPRGSGAQPTRTLFRHRLGLDPAAVTIDGLWVSSLAVTAAQVAASQPFSAGVVVADAALRRHPDTDL